MNQGQGNGQGKIGQGRPAPPKSNVKAIGGPVARSQVPVGARGGTNIAPSRAQGRPAAAAPPKDERRRLTAAELAERYYDLHVRAGLDDEMMRIKKIDYQTILVIYMIGGEDIVFRTKFDTHERNFVLRGKSNATFYVKVPDENRKIPLAAVFTMQTLANSMMTKHESEYAPEEQTTEGG